MLAAIKRGCFLCIVFLRIPGRNLSVKFRILSFENAVNGKKNSQKYESISISYVAIKGKIQGPRKKKSQFWNWPGKGFGNGRRFFNPEQQSAGSLC
jgi:hypothetical protein